MLRKGQRRLCYLLACLLLVTGMYVTFEKADSIARHTVSAGTARIQEPDETIIQKHEYVVERSKTLLRESVFRTVTRNQSLRRTMRLPVLLLYAICVVYFVLKCFYTEEIISLQEKKYRKALIKYIHDIDGKKRMSCLI